MLKFFITICIVFFSQFNSTIVYAGAQCSKPVEYLLENAATPCSGFLFSPEKELDVRLKIANFDNMKLLSEKTEELNMILYSRVTNLQEQNMLLSNELQQRDKTNIYVLIGSFTLGAITTALIAKSLK